MTIAPQFIVMLASFVAILRAPHGTAGDIPSTGTPAQAGSQPTSTNPSFHESYPLIPSFSPIGGYLFSAKGAGPFQPGATPQVNAKSQESGLKARPIVPEIDRLPPRMNRAFSAAEGKRHASWGLAPGWNRDAPLALNTDQPGRLRRGPQNEDCRSDRRSD